MDKKAVIITRTTRLEELIKRYNTLGQAEFFLKSVGENIRSYQEEHQQYYKSLHQLQDFLKDKVIIHTIDRFHLPYYLFNNDDLVIVIGSNGMAVNTIKYLSKQKLIGIKADPKRKDEILLPFSVNDFQKVFKEVLNGKRSHKEISMAKVTLNDQQSLYAVNDFFVGRKTHVSARYTIHFKGKSEHHSSCGVIISTGFGSTGWMTSVLDTAFGIVNSFNPGIPKNVKKKLSWDSESLIFAVREAFPSQISGAKILFGSIENDQNLQITSNMPEEGVIFSDGIESDYLDFRAGMKATIGLANKKGKLII